MPLYSELKHSLIRRIVSGEYESGGLIPSENELREQYEVSRVTVRKALEEMKDEGIISSTQGQGTIVSDRRGGVKGALDIIALIAPVRNPFFASFLECFERICRENGSLVLFKQDEKGSALESDELYYQLYIRNIRNIVLWPQSGLEQKTMLKRLRSIGMNIVFFDQIFETNVADCVGIDNRDAIESLLHALRQEQQTAVGYIGFTGSGMPSEAQRGEAFAELSGSEDCVYTIPWGGDIDREVPRVLDQARSSGSLPPALLCTNGPVGIAAANYLQREGIEGILLAAVDLLPEMAAFRMFAYEQPMDRLADTVYQRLLAQSNQSELWQAGTFLMRGEVVRCSGHDHTLDQRSVYGDRIQP